MKKVKLLDCTLRDGAYIVDGEFGAAAITGIIKKMQDANVEVVECGWLKNNAHKKGTTFFHVPADLTQYLIEKNPRSTYAAMIDWNNYDLKYLPEYDGNTVDAIRVVFPSDKYKEGLAVGIEIQKKGYEVFYQAANTLAYTDEQLVDLALETNKIKPVCLSVVDTFGAMFNKDLEHIVTILDQHLDKEIKLGYHSHNNQQLSFALTMNFVELCEKLDREIIVDASLCGMGRGAGNAPTELMVNYLNNNYNSNYDMNMVMDAIDTYMEKFQEKFSWGYSTPYFIAGMYCCHVNNIAYLQKNHRTNAKDMRNIIESMGEDDRKSYDYDLLEEKYITNQNHKIDDELTMKKLKEELKGKQVLLLAPGESTHSEKEKINNYIRENQPIVIAVNAVNDQYECEYIYFTNTIRYDYAKNTYNEQFNNTNKIVLSNIKTEAADCEDIINFNHVIKRGWEYFDNAMISCLRLMDKLHVENIAIAGFDGFKHSYNESYADSSLPTLNPSCGWDNLNVQIKEMYYNFKSTTETTMNIEFVTSSIFE